MDLSRRMKRVLICLLVCIHLYFRYPDTPRATGSSDSFYIIGMAHSIKENGYMPWSPNFFSYMGFYPFSYPSGAAASLATVWSASGLGPDWSLYIFNTLFGMVGLFGMFMFARTIKKNFMIGYTAAFAFSVSPILFRYTFWTLSARGLFVCLMPIFLWFLFQTLSRRHGLRYGVCTAFMFPVMMSIHHMGLFLPVLFVGYIFAHFTSKYMEKLRLTSIHSREIARSISIMLLAFFVFLLVLQTLMNSFYSPDLDTFKGWYLTGEDNQLVTLLNIGIFYTVSVGILILCGVFGFAHLIEKNGKTGPEWGLLFSLLMFAYFLADQLYLIVFLMPLFMPLIGYGVYVIVTRTGAQPRFSLAVFAAILLTALPHFQYISEDWKDHRHREYGYRRWAYEDTVSTSIYIGQEVDGPFICNDLTWSRTIKAYSGEPGMPFEVSEYPIVEKDAFNKVDSERVNLFEFFFNTNRRKDDQLWEYEWKDENDDYKASYNSIKKMYVTDSRAEENLTRYGISVAVVSGYFPEMVGRASEFYFLKFSRFFSSLQTERYRIYENGHEIVYQL